MIQVKINSIGYSIAINSKKYRNLIIDKFQSIYNELPHEIHPLPKVDNWNVYKVISFNNDIEMATKMEFGKWTIVIWYDPNK
jgi:hypothetical protein